MLKKKYLLFFSLFLLGVFLCTSCLPKPPVTEGILKGQVIVPEGSKQAKELTGQALPDATVNIIDLATGDIIATTTTDANGYYRVFVLAGGHYILQAVKEGMKVQQVTPQVEVGGEYDLGTANCTTTAVALIFQAMLEDDSYPDDPADINLSDIEANPAFDDVLNSVYGVLGAGGDPAVSALVQQAVEYFLHPPTPTPTPNPTPTPLSDARAITAFDFAAFDPDLVGVINEAAKTIALTVPFGTDVTALVPTIVHTGSSLSPASGAAQDFTSPVNYTVTAEDTSTQAYLVTVTVVAAAPVIATTSTIANGAAAPTVTVTGTSFKAGIVAADLTVGVGTTGLTLGTVSFVSATEITVAFTGTAAVGDVTIQAKTSAFDPAGVSASNTLTITVPAAAVINIAAIPGVTAPVTGAVPVTTITATAQYTGTVIWSPTGTFAGSTIYTATITLAPKTGFTLTGVDLDFFKVAGGAATNPINSGVVIAVFPATTAVSITAIGTITGTAQVGVELTAGALTPVGATASYQWQICATSGGTYTDIAGATTSTYTPVAGDATKYIKVVATGTGSYSGTVISAATAAVAALVVGQNYGGGKVAYILQPGETIKDANGTVLYSYNANVQHGLIASIADQSSIGMAWITGGSTQTTWVNGSGYGGTSTAIGTGQANTNAMKVQTGYDGGAAKVCDDYTITVGEVTYSDWYLPSKDELNKLYLNRVAIDDFAMFGYWSSSEYSAKYAWIQYFSDGSQYSFDKSNTKRVRAVRAF